MSWQLRRRLEIGDVVSQRSDGSWSSEYIMRVLDHEALPGTPEEAEAFVRRELDGHPVLGPVVADAVRGVADPLKRAVAAARAAHGHAHPDARAWREKRNVGTNLGGRHPDQRGLGE